MLPEIRFVKNGPLIPSELILAQEQGRVVFFCGAGVSYARAKLPDFYKLAELVCNSLKVSSTSPIWQLLKVKKLERKTKITGLVSMDRIFGILERDFDSRDIDKAVAMALRPANDIDLSAHQILLELAKTSNGRIQLVTTNFDRLFSKCQTSDTRWVAPRLPNLLHHDELDNVVYLHGRVTENYDGAENRFVLSSSEFGRAYLSDGWATEFF